jgi:DNA-binding MarR family transcriptional regulator
MKHEPSLVRDDESDFLMRLLFDAYYWFDESLQRSLQANNIPTLSRSQSMVMVCLEEGIRRPSALARKLRVSRQAMQKTLADMEGKGYLRLVSDPEDRRAKSVRLSKIGKQRQEMAKKCLRTMEGELRTRLGSAKINSLTRALAEDWGDSAVVDASSKTTRN